MKFRGGEFSTGTTGNFQPELTPCPSASPPTTVAAKPRRIDLRRQKKTASTNLAFSAWRQVRGGICSFGTELLAAASLRLSFEPKSKTNRLKPVLLRHWRRFLRVALGIEVYAGIEGAAPRWEPKGIVVRHVELV